MTDLKVYRREYYKNKYHADPEFKAKKKEINKSRYNRLTKDCEGCGARIKKENTNNKCNQCILKEHPQIKADRGRPHIKYVEVCKNCECKQKVYKKNEEQDMIETDNNENTIEEQFEKPTKRRLIEDELK